MKKIIFAVMLGLATLFSFSSCKKDEIVSPVEEGLVSFEVVNINSRIIPEGDGPERLQIVFTAFVESKVDILVPRMLNEGGMLELSSETGELPENWSRNLYVNTEDDDTGLHLVKAGEKIELVYTIYVYPSEETFNLYGRIRGFHYFFTGEDKTLKGLSFDREDKRFCSEVIRY